MSKTPSPRIMAPDVICLYRKEYAGNTLFFIQQLYHYESAIIIDFSNTKYISAAASLALVSHITYIQLYKKNAGCFQFDCKRSPIYKEFFIQGGFLKQLKHSAIKYNKQTSFIDGEFLKVGNVANFAEYRAQNLADITEFERDFKNSVLTKNPLANIKSLDSFFRYLKTAISEVLLNIKNHAYEDGQLIDDNDDFDIYRDKIWWQMFWHSPRDNEITFIVCDLGLGIIRTYLDHATQKRDTLYDNDIEAFKEAISEGKSRFIGQGRGNGLANVVNIAQQNKNIALMILSGDVAYSIRDQNITFLDLNGNRLTGTLIEWVFKLPVEK